MGFLYLGRSYDIERYPPSQNRSLQAWSAADAYLLQKVAEWKPDGQSLAIWHDRFGFLATLLHQYQPWSFLSYHSQEVSIRQNLLRHTLPVNEERLIPLPTDRMPDADLALIRIPKSLDLFRWYLHQAAEALPPAGIALGAFMTRHFTPQLLQIANTYFESVEQSLAWKKARLLLLKQPRQQRPDISLTQVEIGSGKFLQQYPGVFSANQVDPGTRLLLANLRIRDEDQYILDLGTGNGIIAAHIQAAYPDRSLHLLDDSRLAIASAKLNVKGENVQFHTADTLSGFVDASLDCVVSNPPFHLEHENNIEVSLRLFADVRRSLRVGGHFQLVANRHLNYGTHLRRLFRRIEVVKESPRFSIYDCIK